MSKYHFYSWLSKHNYSLTNSSDISTEYSHTRLKRHFPVFFSFFFLTSITRIDCECLFTNNNNNSTNELYRERISLTFVPRAYELREHWVMLKANLIFMCHKKMVEMAWYKWGMADSYSISNCYVIYMYVCVVCVYTLQIIFYFSNSLKQVVRYG